MNKKISLSVILIFVVHISFAQSEILLENYFRTLKSVEVEINHKAYNFLFDTGGGITMVSPEIIDELEKTSYGNNVGYRMSGEKVEYQLADSLNIKIGGLNFFHPYVGVYDLMGLLPKEFKKIDGLISLKTFENSRITLDFNSNKVIVETEQSFRDKVKKMDPVPVRFVNGLNGAELNILLGITEKVRSWWFLFDSGNIAQAKISPSTAKEWGISYMENEVTEIGSYKFKIANDTIITPAIIDHIIYDGALSHDFISQSVYLISFNDRKVWKTHTHP